MERLRHDKELFGVLKQVMKPLLSDVLKILDLTPSFRFRCIVEVPDRSQPLLSRYLLTLVVLAWTSIRAVLLKRADLTSGVMGP